MNEKLFISSSCTSSLCQGYIFCNIFFNKFRSFKENTIFAPLFADKALDYKVYQANFINGGFVPQIINKLWQHEFVCKDTVKKENHFTI